jgi:D-serine deaminase-like pyridoxal phosphate-dependent protein
MSPTPLPWYAVANVGEIDSPALLVYPDRVEQNVRMMLGIAGGPERLRPHMKTHKMAEVIRLQTGLGIQKFKCATIAEAELTASAGATDVLLAYPLVGPKIGRFLDLVKKFPATVFSTIADDAGAMSALSAAVSAAGLTIELLLDIDCGQHRSGVAPGPRAVELYRMISQLPGLKPGGLHVYDGHICDTSLAARINACEAAYAPARTLRQELVAAGLPVPRAVAGGTPTFPMHARRSDVECSPGTCVFWDYGYASRLPDLTFQAAALLLTRVISKPGKDLVCLDLGHKAVASENPAPRVYLLNLPDAKAITHSEEHLVIETAKAPAFAVGDCLYGIPWHICPTVSLHAEAVVVRNGRAVERWKVTARERRLTV